MKTLLLKLLGGLAAIAVLQFPVGYALRETDDLLYGQVQRALAPRADTLLLGDSVFAFRTRQDPKSLLDLLRESAPVGSFDGPGYTPELQLAVLEHALKQGYTPKLVVVSVNLRCFSEVWDLRLQYQYSELRSRLKYGDVPALGLQPPLTSYQIYARLEGYPRTEEDFLSLVVERGGKRLGRMREVLAGSWNRTTPEGRGLAFSVLYQGALEARHRKVQALLRIADLCASAKIPLKMFVTPIDIDSGTLTAGPGFGVRVAQNVGVVQRALGERGVRLEDWSALLRPEHFSYQEYPNEHLSGSGRRKLAEKILGLLNRGP
jgi:hypothetical protein